MVISGKHSVEYEEKATLYYISGDDEYAENNFEYPEKVLEFPTKEVALIGMLNMLTRRVHMQR